jgi:hypothetical protein
MLLLRLALARLSLSARLREVLCPRTKLRSSMVVAVDFPSAGSSPALLMASWRAADGVRGPFAIRGWAGLAGAVQRQQVD